MTIDGKILGTAIKLARNETGLSQEQLAEIVNITPTHIKHIESGHRNPSVDVLFNIAICLNLSLDSILFNKENQLTFRYQDALCLFEKCTVTEQKILIDVMKSMIKNRN